VPWQHPDKDPISSDVAMRIPLCFILLLVAASRIPASLRSRTGFETNAGQADVAVQFLSRGARGTLFLKTGGEALLTTPKGSLRMTLAGASSRAGTGSDPVAGSIHYLIGRDPQRWHTGVSAYSMVKYQHVYPGIDLIYRNSDEQIEYDFVISPGADPRRISLEFSGAERMEVDARGDLVFSLAGQTLRHRKPHVYQTVGQTRHEISGRYVWSGGGRVRFAIADYDRSLPLVIDPVISYGTFLGGSGDDGAFSVTTDSAGNIYVAGITTSADLPSAAPAGGRTLSGASDAFVAKLNPQGTALIYIAYLGGSDQDAALAVAADAQGNAYVTGGTNSKDFPVTSSAFQSRFGGTGGSSLPPFSSPAGDGFVAKLNSSGTLVYSSYLGGNGIDQGYGIAVDASGAATIAGATASTDFPVTSGVVQSARHGFSDVFIARVNPAGSSLLYSTYLGGSGENYAFALALDSSGNAYVTGVTTSDDFPVTPGAFQGRHSGSATAFAAKLNSAGTALSYATYLGGNNNTYAYGVAVDNSGSAYITGATTSSDFPITTGAYQRRGKQGGDVFVSRLSPGGDKLLMSSVFGGNGPDFGRAIALDPAGDLYVAGSTGPYGNGRILDFPTTPDAAQRCGSGNPAVFLVRIPPDGASLKYSSYLSGNSGSAAGASAIALGASGKIILAGSTGASDFPTTSGALQTKFGGGGSSFDSTNLFPFAGDAFVAQVDLTAQSPFALQCAVDAASMAPNLISPGEIVSFFGSGIGPQTGVPAAFDSTGHLPTTLSDTRVLFDGVPAPLLFVRSDQINAVTPFALAGKSSTEIQIEYAGAKTPILNVRVTSATPGIFTADASGSGQAAALNEDNSYNTPSNPARAGSVVVLFATGAGPLDPIPEDGKPVADPLPRTLPVTAYVGSCQAGVLYSGSAPGLIAGAIQVNLRIPETAPPPAPPGFTCGSGNVPVLLLFGGASTQETATISLR